MRRSLLKAPRAGLIPVLLLVSLLGCDRPEAGDPGPPRRVFLITVDTLRADHTGFHGYARDTTPRLDAIAAEGRIYERAIVQWPKTGASFASMFVGRYPQSTGVTHRASVEVPAEYTVLPEYFQRAGFRTLAVVSNPVLSSARRWDRGFDRYVETWPETMSNDPKSFRPHFSALRVNELALPLLRAIDPEERVFVWLHYSDPHTPYLLPEGRANPFLGDEIYRGSGDDGVFFGGRAKRLQKALGDHRELRYYVAQYDANVRVADEAIGEVWDLLRERDLLDDAAVVFTADHGESLGEHGLYFEHGPLPYNASSHVPFFLWGAGVAAQRVAEPVELVDLLPTLADWTLPGVELEPMEGRSRLRPHDREPAASSTPRRAFAEAGTAGRNHYRSVQEVRWKLIFDPPRGPEEAVGADRFELYDLVADPAETRNLLRDEPAVARALRRVLEDWMLAARPSRQEEEAPLDDAEREALRKLGYLQ